MARVLSCAALLAFLLPCTSAEPVGPHQHHVLDPGDYEVVITDPGLYRLAYAPEERGNKVTIRLLREGDETTLAEQSFGGSTRLTLEAGRYSIGFDRRLHFAIVNGSLGDEVVSDGEASFSVRPAQSMLLWEGKAANCARVDSDGLKFVEVFTPLDRTVDRYDAAHGGEIALQLPDLSKTPAVLFGAVDGTDARIMLDTCTSDKRSTHAPGPPAPFLIAVLCIASLITVARRTGRT